jgi:subtilisin family serine protease
MRRLIPLFPLLATAFFSQTATGQTAGVDQNIRVEMADGREVAIPVVTTHDVPVIIEFRDAPLVLAVTRSAKTAMAGYQETFSRFRNDLGAIVNRGISGKSALAAPEFTREYYEAFNGVAVTVPRDSLAALRALPYVKKIHLDKPMEALAVTVPVNVALIRADRVWSDLGTRGKGIVVAIIDTGIDYTHPALGGCLGPGCRVIGGHDFVNNDDDPMDDHFHGTHVAGIIGGNSADYVGVAPEVSFVGYKVLNSKGSGSESNVVAAIERAIDPNQDGDFSDRADVANLSLGGLGNADDAASTAIDNAVAAGTVFAVAAGNSGAPHSIDSPGTARRAITVGASDNSDHMASFSSRGPSPKLISIKPDIVAPGVSIRSSMPGGLYGSLSGTSMATPHVAGVVALIRALHPDWTPAQIKSQLMGTAASAADEVMVQGAGRIDALRAASPTVSIDPPSISLGLDPLKQASWSTTSTLHLTNRGAAAVSYNVSLTPTTGVTVSTSPTSISLAPGESTDLTVNFTFNNGTVLPAAGSFSIGNYVNLVGSGSTGSLRIPWSTIKGARALVNYNHNILPLGGALWLDQAGGTVYPAAPIGDPGDSEVLLAPGKYDFLLYSADIDTKTAKNTDTRVIFLEQQNLDGDTIMTLSDADAPRTLRFDGRTESGLPLGGSALSGYWSGGRMVFPTGSKFTSLQLPLVANRTWHLSDFSANATLLTHEIYFDAANAKMYVVPQRPVAGMSGDVILSGGGSTLKRGEVTLFSGPARFGDRRILMSVLPFPIPASGGVLTVTINNTAASFAFNQTLFMGPETLTGYNFGVSYNSITDGSSSFITPPLRVVGDRLVSLASTLQNPPWTHGGANYLFGSGLVYPLQSFVTSSLAYHPGIYTDFAGELNEVRTLERFLTSTSVIKGDGTVTASGARYPLSMDLSALGPYRIEATDGNMTLFPGIARTATVTMNLDSSRADYFPPVFTAMMLFDGAGRLVSRLDPNGGGWVQFAAADYSYVGSIGSVTRSYKAVAAEQTKAWYRVSGSGAWLPLTVTQVMEDSGAGSTVSAGILFRADLSALTNISGPRQLYDLKFDIQDANGNATSYQLAPAFSVGPEAPPRRRAAGK